MGLHQAGFLYVSNAKEFQGMETVHSFYRKMASPIFGDNVGRGPSGFFGLLKIDRPEISVLQFL